MGMVGRQSTLLVPKVRYPGLKAVVGITCPLTHPPALKSSQSFQLAAGTACHSLIAMRLADNAGDQE